MHSLRRAVRSPFVGVAAVALALSALLLACTTPSSGGGEPTTTTTTTSTTSTTTTTLPPHDVIVDCNAGESCQGTATGEQSSVVVTSAAGDAGEVTIDVNEPGDLSCAGVIPSPFYVEVNPDIFTVNSTTNATKTIAITTTDGKDVLNGVTGAGFWSLQVCFASPTPFTSLKATFPFYGAAPLDAGSGDYVGLLPPCLADFGPLHFDPPCVSDRRVIGNDTRITAVLPAGDPRMK